MIELSGFEPIQTRGAVKQPLNGQIDEVDTFILLIEKNMALVCKVNKLQESLCEELREKLLGMFACLAENFRSLRVLQDSKENACS